MSQLLKKGQKLPKKIIRPQVGKLSLAAQETEWVGQGTL